jgi:hypothetical protein
MRLMDATVKGDDVLYNADGSLGKCVQEEPAPGQQQAGQGHEVGSGVALKSSSCGL